MKTFGFLLVTLQALSPTLNAPLKDSAEVAELEPPDGVHNHEDPVRDGKWDFSFNPGAISISDHSFAGEYGELSVGHFANVENIEGDQITEHVENVKNVENIEGDQITEIKENVDNVVNVENVEIKETASGLSAADEEEQEDVAGEVVTEIPDSKHGLLECATNPPGSKCPVEFDASTLNDAAQVGIKELQELHELEEELTRRNVFVKKGSSAFSHFAFFKTSDEAMRLAGDAMISLVGSQNLGQRFSLTSDQAGFGLAAFDIKGTIISSRCPVPNNCDAEAPYRNPDGTCNNIKNPSLGSARTQFQRIILPEYSDGVWKPKISKSGIDLPSARLVSVNIVPDVVVPHVDAPIELDTHNVMQWGQFLDHDIVHTPLFRIRTTHAGISCCTEDGSGHISESMIHPACFPIEIPADDPFFKKHGQRCMNFVRSMPAPNLECTFGYGEQMNQITHFHDASNVYGSDEEEQKDLRTKTAGLLKVHTVRPGTVETRDFLPQEEGDAKEDCEIPPLKENEERKCFVAGDFRVNEQPGLTVFHTIWMREHNRLAKQLKYLNPHWDDEKLFQTARQILIAQQQHITYNEWLPIVLGRKFMVELDILPVTNGYNGKYNPNINPSIVNSFATAAFRFGHTLVQGTLDLFDDYERKKTAAVPLSTTFFNPVLLYKPGNLDKFLVGLATQPRQKFDNIFTEELTNRLFQPKGMKFGMDLVALNLQRGRDHGLPGYNAFRELCRLKRVSSFHHLTDYIPAKIVDKIKLIYDDVDDVDIFIGGVSETPVHGALLGPTFQCIVGDQFLRLQHGDRFYYDSSSNPGKFTKKQLVEIRKASLARIHCDNSDSVKQFQRQLFKKPSQINRLTRCDAITIPIVDLYAWKEGGYPPTPPPRPQRPNVP